jgi:hypothetical protein
MTTVAPGEYRPIPPPDYVGLSLSHTIDLDEKLFARKACLNRRAGGPARWIVAEELPIDGV